MHSELPMIWRLMIALAAGLVLGLLDSLLILSHSDVPGSLNLLIFFSLLLVGVIARLTVGPRKEYPELVGLRIGGIAWFGIWLAVLVWNSFQPQIIRDCLFSDGYCTPTTVPFWGPYIWIELIIFLFILLVGEVLVIVGVAVTTIVLDTIRWSAKKLTSSR